MWVLVLAASIVALPTNGSATVSDPTVTGPVGDAGIHGHALWDSWFDLTEAGYEEHEYFVSGTAAHATSSATATYTTRIIVTRPSDPDRFSGTVLLDWVNVTAQFENAVDILEAQEFLLREGWAYVHVSAQSAGICCTPLTPKAWDPVRYQSLSHPGDSYANDIFSQVAKAIREPHGVDPMGGLHVERLLAAGQSQSASRLYSYVTQAQPQAGLIDGFLIHGGGSKTYEAPPAAPVLHLLSDAEASTGAPNQTENYRLWEIAGSAHSDFWIGYRQVVGQGPRFAAGIRRSAAEAEEVFATAGNYGEQPHPMHATCLVAGAAFPTRYAVSAALHHLDTWVRPVNEEDPDDPAGKPPPIGPRFAFNGSQLARDADGNALGGIRLPPVDVPVARYVSTSCALGGITRPFSEVELLQRYPTHDVYYDAMVERTEASVIAGFLLPADAADLLARARAAANRWPTG